MARTKRPLTSKTAGTHRRRRVIVAAFLMFGIGTVVAGGLAARHALGEVPGYRLFALEVHGLRLLSGEEILTASGLRPEDSIFDADLDDVAARIGELVWVRSARVERRPPDRLVVTLTERRRIAWLDWQGELFGLDEEGVVLPRGRLTTEGVTDLDLPVIRPHDGISSAISAEPDSWEPVVGERLPEQLDVSGLLAWWLRVRRNAPDLVPEISEIMPLEEGSLRLLLVADDLEVRLPRADDDCLQALLGVLDRVYHDVPDAIYVDLRYNGQAVVGTSRRLENSRARRPASSEEQVVSHG